jgi:hypothetical protein
VEQPAITKGIDVMLRTIALVVALTAVLPALAQEYRIEEVPSVLTLNVAQLKPKTLAFSDHHKDELADPASGLMRFEDWARERPQQKQYLSLFPSFAEILKTVPDSNGKLQTEKLHVYVAESRFLLPKPPEAINLARYATLPILQGIDPSITHRLITAEDLAATKDSGALAHPDRAWCEQRPNVICIQSRYQFEGRLPLGIRLINKLRDGVRKYPEYIEFQSEIRLLKPEEIDQTAMMQLSGLDHPVVGVVEQNIFFVNHIMRFGKFLALIQKHPTDPSKSIATTFMALAVKSDLLEMKKEYANYPVLRNLVPAQVLSGKSSFNTGTSLSAGLPDYTRNRLKAIAALLERD